MTVQNKCPECLENKGYRMIGIVGRMQCLNCNTIIEIDKLVNPRK